MPTSRTLTRVPQLVAEGFVSPGDAEVLEAVTARYALTISPAMAQLITKGEAGIAAQFLPRAEELVTLPEERADPIGDDVHSPLPGLVHRYPDRVLLKVTQTCPVYCRFCFRREMVGPTGSAAPMGEAELDAACAYIAANPAIFEVIMTGGDPLMLSPRRVAALNARLSAIAHVKVLRWHTRVPVVSPERVTEALAQALGSADKATYIAIHANHPAEFTGAAQAALALLHRAGIRLLGQTVLLKGVNAEADVLRSLFQTMLAHSITPLYLHHPDLAPGTAHFRLSIAEGQKIYSRLRGTLSGPAIPAYILDIPGGFGKVDINSPALLVEDAGKTILRDAAGMLHPYLGNQ